MSSACKLALVGKDLDRYSLETVATFSFYKDALSAAFTIPVGSEWAA